jgi:hypothetical protein
MERERTYFDGIIVLRLSFGIDLDRQCMRIVRKTLHFKSSTIQKHRNSANKAL